MIIFCASYNHGTPYRPHEPEDEQFFTTYKAAERWLDEQSVDKDKGWTEINQIEVCES